jgi:membrane complex biogenesis BtpA family protein
MPLSSLWSIDKPVIGMIHLPPLPGSPRWKGSMDQIIDAALADLEALESGGVDGVLVENYGDAPYYPGPVPDVSVAAMTVAAHAIAGNTRLPVGVNVLRNDARAALAIATAAGARFIRVNIHTGTMFTDQGMISGRAHETLRSRRALGSAVAILADVFVKHATPPPGISLVSAAKDCWHRGLADALIVSGEATGEPTDPEDLIRVREAVPEAPVWIGGGLTAETIPRLLGVADGAIVGSALQRGGLAGEGVTREAVSVLMKAVATVRSAS